MPWYSKHLIILTNTYPDMDYDTCQNLILLLYKEREKVPAQLSEMTRSSLEWQLFLCSVPRVDGCYYFPRRTPLVANCSVGWQLRLRLMTACNPLLAYWQRGRLAKRLQSVRCCLDLGMVDRNSKMTRVTTWFCFSTQKLYILWKSQFFLLFFFFFLLSNITRKKRKKIDWE